MQLTQHQKTQQTMSAQMLQSMKILQMSAQELREYIEALMLENPVLETMEYETSEPSETPETPPLFDQLEWAAANDQQNAEYYSGDSNKGDILANMGCYLDEEAGLQHELLSQFEGLQLDPELLEVIRFLVGRLDANGWLEDDIAVQAAQASIPAPLFARALTELQAAEPAGVGARGLSECLTLQMQRLAGDHWLAEQIAAGYLPKFAQGRLGRIAKETGASGAEVNAACTLIRRLNPHPTLPQGGVWKMLKP